MNIHWDISNDKKYHVYAAQSPQALNIAGHHSFKGNQLGNLTNKSHLKKGEGYNCKLVCSLASNNPFQELYNHIDIEKILSNLQDGEIMANKPAIAIPYKAHL